MLAVRITAGADLTRKATKQAIHRIVREAYQLHFHVVVWTSTPCTSGSPWQRVNKAVGAACGDYETADRIITASVPICRHFS